MNDKQKTPFQYLGIPGIISILSLAVGWLAIVFLIQNQPLLGIASAVIAFYLDCLDGYVARRTYKESVFGKQLDGTFDFFNYLVFSALLFWKYIQPNFLGVIVGFVILATGAFRLVRFNIEGFVVKNNQLYYAGIVVCHVSLAAALLFMLKQFFPEIISVISIPVMLIVSGLQVSRILVKKSNTYHFWLSIAAIILIVALGLQIWQR